MATNFSEADRQFYEEAARECARNLPPGHFMETVTQAEQRSITLQSFDLIRYRRPDVHCFNRISLWCPWNGVGERPSVTPDNTVVIDPGPVPLHDDPVYLSETVRPTLAIDFVSDECPRWTDPERQAREAEVGIPYSLVFDADRREVSVSCLTPQGRYRPLRPNARGRFAIPELQLEVAILDGWTRYWFRRRLVPRLTELVEQLAEAAEAELERLRDELKRLEGRNGRSG